MAHSAAPIAAKSRLSRNINGLLHTPRRTKLKSIAFQIGTFGTKVTTRPYTTSFRPGLSCTFRRSKPGIEPTEQPPVGNQMFAVTSAAATVRRRGLKSLGVARRLSGLRSTFVRLCVSEKRFVTSGLQLPVTAAVGAGNGRLFAQCLPKINHGGTGRSRTVSHGCRRNESSVSGMPRLQDKPRHSPRHQRLGRRREAEFVVTHQRCQSVVPLREDEVEMLCTLQFTLS